MAIEQEPKPTKEGVPPAYWPASGDLRVENLSARYSTDGPVVLHDISFHIKSGERVGVGAYSIYFTFYLVLVSYVQSLLYPVGRTGSGKVSLFLHDGEHD